MQGQIIAGLLGQLRAGARANRGAPDGGGASTPLPIRLWTDLCFAATADAAGLRMVTFDRDFERFGLERCLVLS